MTKEQARVSIYTIFARLFAAVAREVTEKFGEEGAAAVAEAVRKFGEERGRHIAARVAAAGLDKHNLANYLACYDMERSTLFAYENEFGEGYLEQKFSQCPFAQAWIEEGAQELGKLYCEQIDAALARGFDANLQCQLVKHLLRGDDYCHLIFSYNK